MTRQTRQTGQVKRSYKTQIQTPARVTKQRPKNSMLQSNISRSFESSHGRSDTTMSRESEPHSSEQNQSSTVAATLLVSLDFGGSAIKLLIRTHHHNVTQFVKAYGGSFGRFQGREHAPSQLLFKDGNAIVGYHALEYQSTSIADLKRLCSCDRNEPADLHAMEVLEAQLGKPTGEGVELEDWYPHFIDYILDALEAEGSFKGDPIVKVIFTSMCGTPQVYHDFMTEIITSRFKEKSHPITLIENVSEPQAALRYLSDDITAEGKFIEQRMVILVDIGGTSVDFIAGVYNSQLGLLQSRYCPLSLVYGGVDLDRTGTEIIATFMRDERDAVEVNYKITEWMSWLTMSLGDNDIPQRDQVVDEIGKAVRTPQDQAQRTNEELCEQLSAAIRNHQRKITSFVTRETELALDQVTADERKNGIVVCLVGGGTRGFENDLHQEIEKAIISHLSATGSPETAVISHPAANFAREAVPMGAMKILQDLTVSNKGSRYRFNWCMRRYIEDSDEELELDPEVLLRAGSMYFPDQEFVHLMTAWCKKGEGLPSLPSKLPIYMYSAHHLQLVEEMKRSSGKAQKELARLAETAGTRIGVIEVKNLILEPYMYRYDVTGPESDDTTGTSLEYQLILSVGRTQVKARLRTAQMDSNKVPEGKPRVVELGRMERLMYTGED